MNSTGAPSRADPPSSDTVTASSSTIVPTALELAGSITPGGSVEASTATTNVSSPSGAVSCVVATWNVASVAPAVIVTLPLVCAV